MALEQPTPSGGYPAQGAPEASQGLAVGHRASVGVRRDCDGIVSAQNEGDVTGVCCVLEA